MSFVSLSEGGGLGNSSHGPLGKQSEQSFNNYISLYIPCQGYGVVVTRSVRGRRNIKMRNPHVLCSVGNAIGTHMYCIRAYVHPGGHQASPSYLTILLSVVCLLVLLLPLEGESPTWPHYSHVTVNQKLIASFALGES